MKIKIRVLCRHVNCPNKKLCGVVDATVQITTTLFGPLMCGVVLNDGKKRIPKIEDERG
jgi:hypothetical protein